MVRRRVSKRSVRRVARRRPAYTRRRVVRRVTRKRANEPCKCPGELSPGAKFAFAQLDPFEPKCLGAKIPDSNTIPSIVQSDTDQVAIAAPPSAGLLVAMAFNPTYNSATLEAGQLGTPDPTQIQWTGTFKTRRNFTTVVNSIEAFRPVAHALRLSCALSPTTATGFVHIGLVVESRRNELNVAVPDYPRTVNEMTGLSLYKRVTLASLTQSPITLINKWIDDTGFRYEDPDIPYSFIASTATASTINFNFNSSWGTLVVMVEGAPTTSSPISVEHLLLSEMLPRKDSFILGTQAAPNSTGTMSAVSTMVGEIDFAHTEAQQESYIQQGLNELSRGAAIAGAQVWNNVAAPLLQRAGYAAVSTAAQMAYNAATGRGGIPGVNSNPARLSIM